MARRWTKAEMNMSKRYANWPVGRRMEAAVEAVLEEKLNQSEAASLFGVSRSKVNQNVRKHREALEAQTARSEEFRKARLENPQDDTEVSDSVEDSGVPAKPDGRPREVPPFREFMETYFPLVCPDCEKHHELPDFHVEMAELITGPAKRILINTPPYHSKSTIATVFSTIYEICRDVNSRTLIVSAGADLAKYFLGQIKHFLTDPDVYETAKRNLIEDFGPFYNKNRWQADAIWVAGRTSTEKDPTVRAIGYGGHIYGIRADRIVFDDIADLENQRNPDRVEQMVKWTMQEAGSRIGRNGKLIFIGTRISAGDVYSHLQDKPAFEILRRSCIVDDQNQVTLWPDHYPYEAAKLQRDSMTHEQWQLVYQNVDTPGIGAAFTKEILEKCRDTSRILGSYDPNWHLIVGLDPAGAGEQSGYTAMVLLGVDILTGKRYLVDIINHKQMKAYHLKDQILEWAERYPLRELRVESNGLQRQLVQYNMEIVGPLTQRNVRVVPHITTGKGEGNKWDPEFGVTAMAVQFHNEMISIPYGDINTRAKVKELEDQLLQFPMGMVTDLAMALWFAELGCKEVQQREVLPMFSNRFKVPGRIKRQRRVVNFGEGAMRSPREEDFGGRNVDPRTKGSKHLIGTLAG